MELLDTHAAIKVLLSKGFTQEQAEGVVSIQQKSSNDLATKSDLALMQSEIKHDISDLKNDTKWLKTFMILIAGLIIGLWFK